MSTRTPQAIEQCIGCSIDVAVYSSRQLLDDGEALCSSCRRFRTRSDKRERKAARAAKLAAPKPEPLRCCCPVPTPEPSAPGECLKCWYPIATGCLK